MLKSERKAVAQAFAAAKLRLSNGRTHRTNFICWALDHAIYDGLTTGISGAKAKKIIETRLGNCSSVTEWLAKNVVPEHALRGNISAVEIQQYRHRWLDALIEEFSA